MGHGDTVREVPFFCVGVMRANSKVYHFGIFLDN